MPDTIATAADFENMLDDNPRDWMTRLVYADFLEESGKDAEGFCQRWMAKNEKCSHDEFSPNHAFQWRSRAAWPSSWHGEELPDDIYIWLSAERGESKTQTASYPSRVVAEADLCQALQIWLASKERNG